MPLNPYSELNWRDLATQVNPTILILLGFICCINVLGSLTGQYDWIQILYWGAKSSCSNLLNNTVLPIFSDIFLLFIVLIDSAFPLVFTFILRSLCFLLQFLKILSQNSFDRSPNSFFGQPVITPFLPKCWFIFKFICLGFRRTANLQRCHGSFPCGKELGCWRASLVHWNKRYFFVATQTTPGKVYG